MAETQNIHFKPQAQSITPANFLTIPRNCFIRANVYRFINYYTLTFSGSVLRPDGTIQPFTQTTQAVTSGSSASYDIHTPEGLLLGLSVTNSNTYGKYPSISVTLTLIRQIGDTSELIANLGTFHPAKSSPDGFPKPNTFQGEGRSSFLYQEDLSNTAGNQLISPSPPDSALCKLIYIAGRYTASATAGNRYITVRDANLDTPIASTTTAIVANDVVDICFAPYGAFKPTTYGSMVTVNLPEIYFNKDNLISIYVTGGQATDEWNTLAINYLISPSF